MFSGNSNLYAKGPILSRILYGPIYLGVNLPCFPNLSTFFIGEILMKTKFPTSYSTCLLFMSANFFCLSCAAAILLLINSIFSLVSCMYSGPKIDLSPASTQQTGDKQGLPYKASNGAIPMVLW